MIANPTTLILGAGASAPIYPIGSALRDQIISGSGAKPYELYLNEYARHRHEVQLENNRYQTLKERFRASYIVSIDAFLAEPENQQLVKEGHIAIAAALLPCESKDRYPDWYASLFNAIRFRDDGVRMSKLKVVTFNYDLSLEHFLFHAFKNAYGLSNADARKMFSVNVEIIHVYGDLGELVEFSDGAHAREYGIKPGLGTIVKASERIKIIGRHDQTREAFEKAFQAIRDAKFVAILGYGFDPLNNENLRLQEAVADRFPFATGFGMGSGARARLTTLAHNSSMIMGGKGEAVKEFLEEIDFLRWINEPHVQARDSARRIMKVFEKGMLPYTR
jgi:hypothetical protein